MSEGLPIIDLGGGASQIALLREACLEHGFFYLTGYNVPAVLERDLEQITQIFFRLPQSSRDAMAMRFAGTAWRGYFGLGDELTSGVPDQKEGIYFGRELPADHPRVASKTPMFGANLFPPELPQMRDVVLAWMFHIENVGQSVLSLVARSLELEDDFFLKDLTADPTVLFRIFHYPAPDESRSNPSVPSQSRWGVGEHTDYGLITLLKQDAVGGLEVKTKNGWLRAPPISGTLVCNLGDMLDRVTLGQYRSTPHRVRNTSDKSRYSWPFFLDPGWDAAVRPLPGAIARTADEDARDRWDAESVHRFGGTYGEYLTRKVAKVFPHLFER